MPTPCVKHTLPAASSSLEAALPRPGCSLRASFMPGQGALACLLLSIDTSRLGTLNTGKNSASSTPHAFRKALVGRLSLHTLPSS